MRRRDNGTRASTTAPAPRRSIVVVDDDVVVPMTLMIALPETTVIEATRRVPGFETIRRVQPDAIVIDRRMPDGDGLGLVRKVRSDPATNDIPIVVLTAGFDERDRPEVMESGADEYLAKPFDPDDLLAVVERLLEGRPPRPHRPVAVADEVAPPAEGPGRAQRRAPLRAATRSTGTGLPAPGTRLVELPTLVQPGPTQGEPVPTQGLPVPTKVTVDAVALGATVARVEQQSAEATAEAMALQAQLEEAQADNRRLHDFVAVLEAKLEDVGATGTSLWGPSSADEGPDLDERVARAEAEAAQLRAELEEARRDAEEVEQLRRELSRAYSEIEILGDQLEARPGGQRLTRKALDTGEAKAAAAKPAARNGRAPRKPRAPRQT